jgi:hypothetical protein
MAPAGFFSSEAFASKWKSPLFADIKKPASRRFFYARIFSGYSEGGANPAPPLLSS